MSFICLADGCRCLGIDPKTLRRWLAQAQLPVQSHPGDGRLKGLTEEHLRLLASAHHRSLPALPQEWPAPAPTAPPPASPELSAELITALQTLSALPAQIAALQQQLAELTALMLPQPPRPPVSPPPAQRRAGRAGSLPLAKAPGRSRPSASSATKRPGPPAHVLPLIESGTDGHYVVICPKDGLLPFEPETPAWFAWLATLSSFRFVGKQGRLTAHREVERLPRAAWRAHRQIRSHTYNLHLGQTEDLTITVLEQAAAALHSHLK